MNNRKTIENKTKIKIKLKFYLKKIRKLAIKSCTVSADPKKKNFSEQQQHIYGDMKGGILL